MAERANSKRFLGPVVRADEFPHPTGDSFRCEKSSEAADIPAKLKGHLEVILADAKAGAI